MSDLTTENKPKVYDLGWAMARAQTGKITIVSPSDSDGDGVIQACSIVLCRKQDIIELRAACDKALTP